MKALFATLLVALSLVYASCGGTTRHARSVSAAQVVTPAAGAPTSSASVATKGIGSLEQDEDDDDGPGEEKGLDPKDSDIDGDNDHLKPLGYYDHDDGILRTYGHAAGGVEKRDLTAFARRYYAAAAVGDGATACSMFTAVFAKSVPEDYGRGSAGPSFLRQAATCPAVLTLVFNHLHPQFTGPIKIIRVRAKGNQGRVLVGSKNMPASYLELHREGSGWRSVGMFGSPLP